MKTKKQELIERILALTPAQLEAVIKEWERQELIELENGHIKPTNKFKSISYTAV